MPLVRGESVLDVGCGMGKWGVLIRSNYYDAGLSNPPLVDGLDAWQPMVDVCSSSGHYERTWRQELPSPLEGTWDTILAVEVIEHIPQESVDETLSVLEGAARRRVIVSTPNWPAFRPGLETSMGFSEHEAHLSYVPRAYFRDRGYKVIGAGMSLNPKSYPGRLARFLRLDQTLSSLPRSIPRIGDLLIAYKDVG